MAFQKGLENGQKSGKSQGNLVVTAVVLMVNKLAAFKKPPIGEVWQIGCFYDNIPLLILLL